MEYVFLFEKGSEYKTGFVAPCELEGLLVSEGATLQLFENSGGDAVPEGEPLAILFGE